MADLSLLVPLSVYREGEIGQEWIPDLAGMAARQR
jgi:hypothetical protein